LQLSIAGKGGKVFGKVGSAVCGATPESNDNATRCIFTGGEQNNTTMDPYLKQETMDVDCAALEAESSAARELFSRTSGKQRLSVGNKREGGTVAGLS
jgi:hypothetical protein